jgi:hypothetical protein
MRSSGCALRVGLAKFPDACDKPGRARFKAALDGQPLEERPALPTSLAWVR